MTHPGQNGGPPQRPVAWQVALAMSAIICTLMVCLTAIIIAIIIFW